MLYDADLPDDWLLQVCFPQYCDFGARWPEAAAFFGVKESTVKTWWRERKMPYMARKLCLLKRNGLMSLHSKEWEGFSLIDGVLHTPVPGYSLSPNFVCATWYLVANQRNKPDSFWQLALASGDDYLSHAF
jgi:hypothetical protein